MAYVQLCCSSIGALLKSSNNGAWISNVVKFLKLLTYHKLKVDFGPNNLTFFHSSFFIYFNNILALSISLLLFVNNVLSLNAMSDVTSS